MTAIVTGPARAPLPFGLFSVLPFRTDANDRWLTGVQFETLGEPSTERGVSFEEVCAPEDLDLSGSGLDLVEAAPFEVYATYQCSVVGNPLALAAEVARARLEENEERFVEAALATGAFGQSPNFEDDAETVELADNSVPTLTEAVALLEKVVGDVYGFQGIFHVSRGTAALLLEEKLAEKRGQRLYTVLGTPIVAGSGYAFDGIVATPGFVAYRGEVTVPGNPQSMLNRSDNVLTAVASRPYLLGLDSLPILEISFDEALGETKALTP